MKALIRQLVVWIPSQNASAIQRPGSVLVVLAWWCLLLTGGCSRESGFSGQIPAVDVFLSEQGALGQGESALYATQPLPPDIASLEIILEVLAGGADLSAGLDETALDYFSNGPNVGDRKIVITPESRQPLKGGVWYIQVSCPFEEEAIFTLTAKRSQPHPGSTLLDVEGLLAPGAEALYSIEVPAEAEQLELDLLTVQGDTDLFVGVSNDQENYWAANPGTGHDVVVITAQSYLPLAEGTWSVRVETWQHESSYRLIARTY